MQNQTQQKPGSGSNCCNNLNLNTVFLVFGFVVSAKCCSKALLGPCVAWLFYMFLSCLKLSAVRKMMQPLENHHLGLDTTSPVSCVWSSYMSHEKRTPGWLGYIGDQKLHSYIGIVINHDIRIPINQPV